MALQSLAAVTRESKDDVERLLMASSWPSPFWSVFLLQTCWRSKSADVTNSEKKRGKVMFTAIARKDLLHLTFIQDGGHSFSQDVYDELEEFIKE